MLNNRYSFDRRSFVAQNYPLVTIPVPQANDHVIQVEQQPAINDVPNHEQQQVPASHNIDGNNKIDEDEETLKEPFFKKWKRRIKRTAKGTKYAFHHKKKGKNIYLGLSCGDWCK